LVTPTKQTVEIKRSCESDYSGLESEIAQGYGIKNLKKIRRRISKILKSATGKKRKDFVEFSGTS
jgi:hypothetical protein